MLVKELQGLGLRVDLIDDAELVDAEHVLLSDNESSGVSAEELLGDNSEEDTTVGDEADEFGEIELDESMSIETADEYKDEDEKEA